MRFGGASRRLQFDPTVRIFNADNTITERMMNHDGGYYDMDPPVYDDSDAGSMDFGGGGDDEEFLDAMDGDASGYFKAE